MAKAKKVSVADTRKPKHPLDANRPARGGKNQRDASTVRRLNMYKKTATRDKRGKILHQDFQSKDLPNTRIQPNRGWFQNSRVTDLKALEKFREEMSTKVNDAYTVLLREKKLPMALLEDPEAKAAAAGKAARASLVQTQPFAATFGVKRTRKRPKLAADSLADLVTTADRINATYAEKTDPEEEAREEGVRSAARDRLFDKGQSKRIWGELFKVVDSSDVVIQVLDARDPLGTRCRYLEHHLRKNARHKHVLLLLNKCDLVPAWVTKRWLKHLSAEFPTLAFHASITNPFGKGSLLGLLRQLARLRSDKKYISVGFVGYPNVGKSSVINTLRTKKVCKVAPVPGETKVWQYITLMKRIFLIDCPGVVYSKAGDSETQSVLKGVVRVENLEDATETIAAVLERVKPEYLRRAYKLAAWVDATDFLTQLARASGKLGRGGEPDLNTAAKMVLHDWQRGKIPFFELPPGYLPDKPAAAPAEAVTAEDAGAGDGDAATAAAAAAAVVESAAEALREQAAQALPVREDYFLAEDVAASPGNDAGEDRSGSGADEGPTNSGSSEDDSDAESTSSAERGAADGDGSDAESDGYGEAGLSWEAVMQSIQEPEAEAGEADAAAEEAPPAAAARQEAPAADAGSRKIFRKRARSNGVPPSEASQNGASFSGRSSEDSAFEAKDRNGGSLDSRILSGEFTHDGSTKEKITRLLRKVLAKDRGGPGRALSYALAKEGLKWRAAAAARMPEARGDIRQIVGQPVFVPLYKLFLTYGKVFRLSFGPKSFVVVSDAALARQILLTNAGNYSKGLLSEILDFVMGNGLIPADGEIWKSRRRAIVPSLHRKYIESMVAMFGDSALHGARTLQAAALEGRAAEMENFFSRLTLDIIGRAVFNYDFDSLTHDDPVIKAVYTVLREAEYRSTALFPYWNVPLLRWLVPRQRRCSAALGVVNQTLNTLISECKRLVEEEDAEFVEEFLSAADPSILHFLLASGEQISSKQLRDDLMTMLIAGHETTAAVLTWTMHCLAARPDIVSRLQAEIDAVVGDGVPGVEQVRGLRLTTRVINEAMRLYPQPPVLIRRALGPDTLGAYHLPAGADLFISVWNLHRSPEYWAEPNAFNPDRFPLDAPVPNEVTENFAYLPFGGGKRKCIGDQFALFESVVALAVLLRRFEFTMAPNAPPVNMTTGATIHTSGGLYMNVRPRAFVEDAPVVARPEPLLSEPVLNA
ncbi:hypothetical protein WJX81_000578 [Elliptochloris bilobata]|uniref:Nuclear/nucleolar GTPase 2 n=1 Tax=Elliptochloris bilobata TaxID=381761 RepID=A0AAW1QHQ2_9CHLO